jgi:DNA-directed RNA polymerase alpha subunit
LLPPVNLEQEVEPMPNHYKERWEGPIRGLRLPLAAWNSLHNEGITTIDQLTAVADRLERLPGIGLTMARVIREELARVSAPE